MSARVRAFTYNRQRLGDPAGTASAALTAVVAVYSAHPTAPLALAARTGSMTAAEFRALETKRAAVRIPGMRGSAFLAPTESAAMVFASARLSAAQVAKRLQRGGMDAARYASAADRVVAAAATPRLPRELEEAAGVSGMEMSVLLRTLRFDGRLVARAEGSLRAANLRWVATEAWVPGALEVADPDAAAVALARAYLSGYGPARVADFTWWTGLPKGVAARALVEVDTIDVGEGLLLHRGDEAAFGSVPAVRNTVDLLPKWDAYTMGHAPDGRRRFIHPDNQPLAYVRKGVVAPGQPNIGLPGDGYPVVLVGGEAVGTWSVSLKGATYHLFDSAGEAVRRRIEERLASVEALLSS